MCLIWALHSQNATSPYPLNPNKKFHQKNSFIYPPQNGWFVYKDKKVGLYWNVTRSMYIYILPPPTIGVHNFSNLVRTLMGSPDFRWPGESYGSYQSTTEVANVLQWSPELRRTLAMDDGGRISLPLFL